MPKFENSINFFQRDYHATLFPLVTNYILISNVAELLGEYIYVNILKDKQQTFLPQSRVYASKQGMHLRRTVKLDPVAEFYMYDLIYRNRTSFRRDFTSTRTNFGYRFESGEITSTRESYSKFQADISSASKTYTYSAKFDISSYFNSIYHHDLVRWFNAEQRSAEDVKGFDAFLKQINSGRSVDCLPQGIMPCKIIGSHFLKFIDNSNRIKSELLLRFMDDFYLFSNNFDQIIEDFALIQRLLGEKGLSVNPSKTKIGEVRYVNVRKEIDDIKKDLLEARREALSIYDIWDDDDDELDMPLLEQEHIEYLLQMLKGDEIEEEDAELILTLMQEHTEDVTEYLGSFLKRFPNLSKNIFHFCKYISDKNFLAQEIHSFLKEKKFITEYQLFWLAKTAETYLKDTSQIGDILLLLLEHPNASDISKAKVLEIEEKRFGMDDLREEHLRTGKSDWLAWASAIGSRVEPKANRNHLLSYFSNGSPMNKIIADCVINL